MKTLTALLASALLVFTSGAVSARDISPDEAATLRAAGSIKSAEQLNAVALARHPGATINDTELDEKYGKHVYEVELTDPRGIHWDVDIDAATGKVLKNHQDR
ncbi:MULTISPECIES: PepSY domain-containing protein [Pseudomonas]|uniref:PepSY domain-containing protein n=1 Tax=Pseudomonas phytophila TaxID=2867264 RepID=A0ABY6F9Q3_9PSED|nr:MULTISPECIES: PepSY domain-containing protein [Pseudomonas]MCQ2995535.1 PepSY domain-containing protein [Pseudomonas syringae]RMR08252.1 Peptidase propeptide and YpeB domain-containing protein [Pseudomonas savastanoi pv. glycinea]MCD5988433.1 PepSY domain-containing protein [Pseudomonas quasicaspiana]MCQ3002199.1 PepSY domain-containing protein [Pseudomonas syringae]MCQ3032224.1 PepSY domain-containing protein [Pseudomonas syringae]